jgi:hypothetical protein
MYFVLISRSGNNEAISTYRTSDISNIPLTPYTDSWTVILTFWFYALLFIKPHINLRYQGAYGMLHLFTIPQVQTQTNMINKINKEMWRSMNATPHDSATTSGKEHRRTPNKNRTSHKEEHGHANH